jgi:hypothetical protein
MDDMTVFDEMVSDYLSAANAEEEHSTRSNHHQIKGALLGSPRVRGGPTEPDAHMRRRCSCSLMLIFVCTAQSVVSALRERRSP